MLDRYDATSRRAGRGCATQVVHGDLNLDNVLLDDDGRISGIVDFGDIGHTAQVGDFAIGSRRLSAAAPLDDVFRVARIAIDGYQSRHAARARGARRARRPRATRLAAIVVISAWRVARYPENAEYIQAWDDDCWRLLELIGDVGCGAFLARSSAPRPRRSPPAR